MSTFKINRLLRNPRQTSTGGLLLVRQVLNQYASLEALGVEFGNKLFGIPLLAVWVAMVFRAVLKGLSLRQFNKTWNNDKTLGMFAGYRHKLTQTLLSRNLTRFHLQGTRRIVMGMIKNLHSAGKVEIKQLAIDSTNIEAKGKKYQKTGTVKIKGKWFKGYKLHIAFDLVKKIPVAYILTPVNVHDSQMLVPLLKMIQSQYGNTIQEVVLDRGYYGKKFFQFFDDHNIKFIIPAKRYKSFKKLIKQAKAREFTPVRNGSLWYKDTKLWLSGYGSIRCLLIANKKFEDWMPEEARAKIMWGLLTNDQDLLPYTIILRYRARWQIEVFFRSCRQQLGLGNLPGYDFRTVSTHVGSVLLAYLVLATLAIEEVEADEVLEITVLDWVQKYVLVSMSCQIIGRTVNVFFQEEGWLFYHLEAFYPSGGIKI